MKPSRSFLIIFLACVITQKFAEAVPVPDDEAPPEEAAAPPAEAGGAGKDGTAEAIRENPEDSKSYINHGRVKNNRFQGSMDSQFEKKKLEGEAIQKQGEDTRVEADHMQGRFEKGHYDQMYKTFKWADGEMDQAVEYAGKEDKGKGKKKAAGGGEGGEAEAEAPAPAEE